MRYIEKENNVTKEYEVIIDDVELEKIIKELNARCCRIVKANTNVMSTSKEMAIDKISFNGNREVNIVKEIELADSQNHLNEFAKPQFIYECEYFYKQVTYLEYLLSIILRSYRSKNNANNSENAIKLLLNYENNDELIPYIERMARDGIKEDLLLEYENNKDYDFELLNKLYQRAKDCFKLILISETIHYDNNENNSKVYKLGTRK